MYSIKIFSRTQVLFVGPLIPLFWTSGDVCPGFQSQGGFLTCELSRMCKMDSSDSLLGGQDGSWSHSIHAYSGGA